MSLFWIVITRECDEINIPSKSAVYSVYDGNDQLLYIGETSNLRMRSHEMFSGTGHLAKYAGNFRKIRAFFVEGRMNRHIYYVYLANLHKPPLNFKIPFSDEVKQHRYGENPIPQKQSEKCKYEKRNGKRCMNHVMKDGYCRMHYS